MSRLVDIEDVKALINGLDSLPWEEEIDDLVNSIPTAYDVEKVVDELESEKIIHYGLHTEETDIMKIDDAIAIVKKGGA